MKQLLFTIIFIITCSLGIHSQHKMIIPDHSGKNIVTNTGSEIITTPLTGTISSSKITENWDIKMTNLEAHFHTTSISKELFSDLKNKANARRNAPIQLHYVPESTRNTPPSPYLNHNFRGNIRGNSVPMDNTVAVSKNGFIVSAINTNIIFTNPAGEITFTKNLSDFFTLLGLGTRMYDPRAIYDIEENKFIFMCLHGSDPGSTELCLAFSKTEDPNGEWNYYKISGNPANENNWFDYPNIGVSKADFYIAGLMRNVQGDWQYSVMYQIDKKAGFDGKELQWKYYNKLFDADGQPSFNLVPAISGWDYLTSPGMYFVSNQPNGGNKYNLYYTDASLHNNPTLTSLQTTALPTELAPDGRMLNTSKTLNTFDSRIWSAMYLNGTIHMGSHVNTPTGDVGLFYGRMDVSNMHIDADIFTQPRQDYGFPSFAAFGKNENDPEILVNYLLAGPDIYPGQEQRVCTGIDSSFEWSAPVLLKSGTGIVSVLSDNRERWGDYTTCQRRFSNDRTEVWVTGCFGESGSYGTWLGQYLPEDEVANGPIGDFVADLTTTPKNSIVSFKDITSADPIGWNWTFPGGTPSTSTEQHPKVSYEADGVYDVTLMVTNALGSDTITKHHYIHIQDPVEKPIANFIYSNDTVYVDDFVQFTSTSSANTINHRWTFVSGTPPSSADANPLIQYKKTGAFHVSLTVQNIAGTNNKTVPKAITVIKRTQPKADFISSAQQIMTGDSISFIDLTTGGPREWLWNFEGGTPATSTEANPTIVYENEGTFNVSLQVKNEAGTDFISIDNYVTVGTSAVKDEKQAITRIYPNPIHAGDIVYTELNVANSSKYRINLLNDKGQLVKTLYNDKIKSGHNVFSFSTYHLHPGLYLIEFVNPKANSEIKRIVIID